MPVRHLIQTSDAQHHIVQQRKARAQRSVLGGRGDRHVFLAGETQNFAGVLCAGARAVARCVKQAVLAAVHQAVDKAGERFAALGADGIVIGVLTPEGDLDEERMAKLISLAGGCGVTLHRAFDVCRDPFAALETAKRLGVDTILTSGQQADCTAGADLLRALVAKAGEDVQILVGAGVNADVIRDLQPKTGANAFHLSAKRVENSRMQFRRENVPMGLPGLSEFSLWQCDENAVRAAREAFDACCGAGQEART